MTEQRLPTKEEILIVRAALALYQAKSKVYTPGERLIQDCINEAITGHENLPVDLCDRIEAIALSGSDAIEEEILGLNAEAWASGRDACGGITFADFTTIA